MNVMNFDAIVFRSPLGSYLKVAGRVQGFAADVEIGSMFLGFGRLVYGRERRPSLPLEFVFEYSNEQTKACSTVVPFLELTLWNKL